MLFHCGRCKANTVCIFRPQLQTLLILCRRLISLALITAFEVRIHVTQSLAQQNRSTSPLMPALMKNVQL